MLSLSFEYEGAGADENDEFSVKLLQEQQRVFVDKISVDAAEPRAEALRLLVAELMQTLHEVGVVNGTVVEKTACRINKDECTVALNRLQIELQTNAFEEPIREYLNACLRATLAFDEESSESELLLKLRMHAKLFVAAIKNTPEARMAEFKQEVFRALENSVAFSECAKAGLPLRLKDLSMFLGLSETPTKKTNRKL